LASVHIKVGVAEAAGVGRVTIVRPAISDAQTDFSGDSRYDAKTDPLGKGQWNQWLLNEPGLFEGIFAASTDYYAFSIA
jgi:hypothetical protein